MSDDSKNVTNVIELKKPKQDGEEIFWEGLAKISDEDISRTNLLVTELILKSPTYL